MNKEHVGIWYKNRKQEPDHFIYILDYETKTKNMMDEDLFIKADVITIYSPFIVTEQNNGFFDFGRKVSIKAIPEHAAKVGDSVDRELNRMAIEFLFLKENLRG